MDRFLYLADRVVLRSDAGISPLDRGFLQGEGLFETVRISAGVPLWIHRHARRLSDGLRRIGIDPAVAGVRRCRGALVALARAEGVEEAVGRITVSPGPEIAKSPTFVAHLRPLPVPPAPGEEVAVAWSPWRRDPRCPWFALKSTSWLASSLALRDARGSGAFEVLTANLDGTIAEGAFTNVFLCVDGVLVTPSRASGILPGIARDRVLRLAHRAGIVACERAVAASEVASAEECFLTNAVRGIVAVDRVGDRCFPSARPVTARLTAAWARAVRASVARYRRVRGIP